MGSVTFRIDDELADRVKNAVYWTPGLTMRALAERALLREVDALEKKRGEPFPKREGENTGGRPLGR